jgi:pimeloyl-ACP methyl ester carboxylesterase
VGDRRARALSARDAQLAPIRQHPAPVDDEEAALRVAHDGIELNVEVEGREGAPPVAFLHGVSGSARTYAWLPGEITDGRRILRIDLRGHGRSGHAPGTYLIDRYGADVAEVLRQVAGRPAVLVGHSLGGNTAWWVAQHHPELVAAAFLEDPPLFMGEPAEHENNPAAKIFPAVRDNAIAMREEGLDVDAAAARLAAAPMGPDRTMGDVLLSDALLARAEAHLALDPEVLTRAADGTTLAGTDLASPVAVPTLILAAGAEPAFKPEHEERLARTHPGVEVVRVPGASHFIHSEQAHRATFAEHLAAFLARHAPVGASV